MILADILLNPGKLINNCDWVFCVIFVPPGNQFIAGLADGFAVENGAAEDARDIQAVVHGRVGAEGDGEVAIEIDGGRESADPIHFDGAARTAKLNDLVADFLDGLVHSAFYKAGGAGDGPNPGTARHMLVRASEQCFPVQFGDDRH